MFDILFGAKEQPAEEAAATEAPATVPVAETAVTEAVVAEEAAESAEVAAQKEEASGFFDGLFGRKKEASEEAVAEEATASTPVAPSSMPQAYGQPSLRQHLRDMPSLRHGGLLRTLAHLPVFMTCLHVCLCMTRDLAGKSIQEIRISISHKLIELKCRDYRGLFCFVTVFPDRITRTRK